MVDTAARQSTQNKTYMTLADFLSTSANQPVEIVNGEMVVIMSPTQRPHIRIAHRLYHAIYNFVQAHQLGSVWMETAYILSADERNDWVLGARVPDISFIAAQRMKKHDEQYGSEGPWRLAPDLAVEIVSPTDRYTDVTQKVIDYLQYGVRLVWVIDPKTRTIRVHSQDDPDGSVLGEADQLTGAEVFESWTMPVKDILDQSADE